MIKYKKLNPKAKTPEYAHVNADAGMDLYFNPDDGQPVTLLPGDHFLAKTGIAVEIPHGYVGLVCAKSGRALKEKLQVLNSPGVIDNGYLSDVGAILHNAAIYDINPYAKTNTITIEPGQKIAQLLIMPVVYAQLVEVDSFEDTDRGIGGFGSSGL